MKARIEYNDVAPALTKALLQLEAYVNHHTGLDPVLLNLVRMRASQINGCAYCIDMHSKDLRAQGETEQRIYELDAWREAPFYSDRERAALEWAEAVTLVSQTHVPDEVYERVRKQFSEADLVNLTAAIVAINSWNRLSISFRTLAGTYQPAAQAAKKTA
jgi:AhpD family alkylhydroperoxidase